MRPHLALSGAAALALALPAATNAQSCDRACLQKTLDAYLAAVTQKHDPKAAPLARGYRQTENAVESKAGEGIWKTASGLGKVQRRYFDPVTGNAAYFGLVEEPGAPGPALVGMRIKVDGKKQITEGEWIIARKGMALWNPDGLIAKPPPADTPLPKGQQMKREDLLTVGASYFVGIAAYDGTKVIAKDGCLRLENGTQMTGRPPRPPRPAGAAGGPPGGPGGPPPGAGPVPPPPPAAAPNPNAGTLPAAGVQMSDCKSGYTGLANALSGVSNRRFPVVDTEAGVVMGIGIFSRALNAQPRNGKLPERLFLTEFFGAPEGKIETVYAAMHYLPNEAPEATGW